MHNYAFNKLDLNYVYLPFDINPANLKEALRGMAALGITGFNVTIPHKERIVEYLDELSDGAKIVNAVNTVVNENGKLLGYNTDIDGIAKTLEAFKEKLNGKTVSLFGAGGAARAVIYTLITRFNIKEINIINRTVERAESLKDYFTSKLLFEKIKTYELIPPDLVKVLQNSTLIINTTSIGMSPEEDDTPTSIPESFNKNQIVFDVIYTPRKTKLLEIAESRNAITLNGLKMFIEQGAKAFELWTNKKMPVEKIEKILTKELKV
jgi:shikimate dehydrogenase